MKVLAQIRDPGTRPRQNPGQIGGADGEAPEARNDVQETGLIKRQRKACGFVFGFSSAAVWSDESSVPVPIIRWRHGRAFRLKWARKRSTNDSIRSVMTISLSQSRSAVALPDIAPHTGRKSRERN